MDPRYLWYCGIILFAIITVVSKHVVVDFLARESVNCHVELGTDPRTTPEDMFHNLAYLASEELSSVNTLMEMVNGLEQFRELEKESIYFDYVADAIFNPLWSDNPAMGTPALLQKRKWVSENLKALGDISRAVGTIVSEVGRGGKGGFDRLRSSYIRFERDLNDARKEETPRSIKIMLRARCRLLKSIKKELVDWQTQVRKANSRAYSALQIAEGLDMNMAEYDSLQPLPDAELRTVTKMFGFFKRFIRDEKFDDVSGWLRLIPKPLLVSDAESLTVSIKLMERCRRALENARLSVAMLLSGLDAFYMTEIESAYGKPAVKLDRSNEDILARVRRGLRIIESQIKLSPWTEM